PHPLIATGGAEARRTDGGTDPGPAGPGRQTRRHRTGRTEARAWPDRPDETPAAGLTRRRNGYRSGMAEQHRRREQPEDYGVPDYADDTTTAFNESDLPRFEDPAAM